MLDETYRSRSVASTSGQAPDLYNEHIYEEIVDLIKGKVSKLRLLTYTKLLFAIKTLEAK